MEWGWHQLCPLLQLLQCHGPMEITVKVILHISQSWTRWQLAGGADPSRQEASASQGNTPTHLHSAQDSPRSCLPQPTTAFCPNQFIPPDWEMSLLCIRNSSCFSALSFRAIGFGRWSGLDSTLAQGHPQAWKRAALGKCGWRRKGKLCIAASADSTPP